VDFWAEKDIFMFAMVGIVPKSMALLPNHPVPSQGTTNNKTIVVEDVVVASHLGALSPNYLKPTWCPPTKTYVLSGWLL